MNTDLSREDRFEDRLLALERPMDSLENDVKGLKVSGAKLWAGGILGIELNR